MTGPDGAAIAVAAVLGLIFGSFANVCIHRLPERRSVVRPGSACMACGRGIAWFDNIPVVSWLLLAGRCRACGARIAPIYPLVEAACAVLLAALCARHGLSPRWAALGWLVVSIVILIPIDLRHGILPDRVTLPGIAVGIALSALSPDPGLGGSLRGAAAGALVPLGVRSLYMAYASARSALRRRGSRAEAPAAAAAGRPGDPSGGIAQDPAASPQAGPSGPPDEPPEHAEERREGMGLGDVKMLAMVGAFLGAPMALLTMLLGSMMGALYVLPLVAAGRQSMKSPVPFGPFLGVAALVAVFWGERIVGWYLGLVIAPPFG
ncbi:MAG TPA: prepilin peptidase [Candidatus Polarisedimenticolia bacterium]|nr:prepilin peptidase [Candidatus Polarisedimenticolia bacterium]